MTATCVIVTRDGLCAQPCDGYLCRAHRSELRTALQALPGLLAELEITATRQSQTSTGNGARTKASEEPIAFDWDAADLDWAVRNTVITWARHVLEERYSALPAIPPGPVCEKCFHPSCAEIRHREWLHRAATPPQHFAALCGWLAGHVDFMAGQPEADAFYDEIRSIRPFANRTVDTREDRYAGPCTAVVLVADLDQSDDIYRPSERVCGADLRLRNGSQVIRCRACGAQYDAAERAGWIDKQSADHLATAAEIAAAMHDAGLARTTLAMRKRINQWARRTRQWLDELAARDPDDQTPIRYERHPIQELACNVATRQPLYRLGDVYERVKSDRRS